MSDKKVKIPLIVMQTWKDKNIPAHWKSSQNAIRNIMPHWKYVLMTDEDNRNFCAKHFPDFLPIYDSFEYGIMRADAIRYMWLYINGGLYLDLDIEVTKPFDDLFYEDHDIYGVRSGNYKKFYTNAIMASKPRVPFWLKCIEDMKVPYRTWQIGKHLKVMRTTGPLMLSKMLIDHEPDIGQMPAELLTACTVCDPKPCNIKSGYAKTLEGSSWVAWDTKVYTFCACNSGKIMVVLLSIILVLIFVYILYRRSLNGPSRFER